MTEIPLEKYGRAYIPIRIKPQYDITMSPIEFKVDTGADNTTISKVDLVSVGHFKL